LALLAGAVALVSLSWPEATSGLWPLALRPLHTRCLGALYAATALCLLLCALDTDEAVARISLNLVLWGAVAMPLAATSLRPVPWTFISIHALAAACAAVMAWRGRELSAPAERADGALLVMAAVLGGVALALAFAPAASSGRWPWPMAPAVAPFYAAALSAWALAALQLARERRRAGRRVVLTGLAVLGLLLLGASLLHARLFFAPGSVAAGWLWFASLLAGTATASLRLWRRRRPALR
jgi:hypothetical protein